MKVEEDDLPSYFAIAHYVYFLSNFQKIMPPTYWTLFFAFKWFGIELRPSRKMAEGF